MNSKHNNTTKRSESCRRLGRRLSRAAVAISLLGSMAFGPTVAAQTSRPSNVLLIADGLTSRANEGTSVLKLMVGKSSVLTTKVPYKRVNVAGPEVADVNPIGTTSVLV